MSIRPLLLPLAALLALGSARPLAADVKLASPFGSHMVLQRSQTVPVWGTAEPAEKVTVKFGRQKKSTVADAAGRWRIELAPLAASARPRSLVVTGSRTATPLQLDDVLVGEVWLCGGQSNMERQLGPRPPQKPITDWEQEVAAARHPQLRELYVTQTIAYSPGTTVPAKWTVCSPGTVADFSAVGYFFGRDLQAHLGVPVGIIHASWGGTPAESWTSAEGLREFPEFAEALTRLKEVGRDPVAARREHAERLARWYPENDPGSGAHAWSSVDLDLTDWETMELPAKWEEAGHPDFDGIVWFRRTFDAPAGWKGGDLELHLSAIDDDDTTWVNGTQVGATSLWNEPRVYRVPAGLVKRTGNVIAVRVTDSGGNGGIWDADQPFEIRTVGGSASPISLRGPWWCRFAVAFTGDRHPPTDVMENPGAPTVLYNGMIAPLVPFAMRGVAFYQGENNAYRALQYRTLFPALIANWRKRWGEGDFPFLFVQIAPFREQPPEIREAQFLAWQATPQTAMVVTIDCGDADDIHPPHKQPVGARLALAARALAYGEKVEYSGPAYQSVTLEGNRAVLHFTHLGGGLVAASGPLTGFTVAGSDGVFHPAKAEIVGDTLAVSAAEVAQPAAVRYAWANVAAGNLFNRAGLPASPFRTDSP